MALKAQLSRPKRTCCSGLVVIITGAGLAGTSDTVLEIVGWRALRGLGSALFIATALATIVSSSPGFGRAGSHSVRGGAPRPRAANSPVAHRIPRLQQVVELHHRAGIRSAIRCRRNGRIWLVI
jgi:hypothetical protein